MKVSELRSQSAEQLKGLVATKKAELSELFAKRRTEDFKKSHQFNNLRKDIARALTVLREKTLAENTKGDS